jgi:hypothetical protein
MRENIMISPFKNRSTFAIPFILFLLAFILAGCGEENALREMREEKQLLSQRIDRAIDIIDQRLVNKAGESAFNDTDNISDNTATRLKGMKNSLKQQRIDMATIDLEQWPQFSSQLIDELLRVKTTLDTMQVPTVVVTEDNDT